MFRTVLLSTPFYNDAANECFYNIHGRNYSGDVTFLSTLRAFLGSRIDDDVDFYLSVSHESYTSSQIEGLSSADIAYKVITNLYDPNDLSDTLCVAMLSGVSAVSEVCLNAVYEAGHTVLKEEYGWHRVDNVTAMFKQRKTTVVCFVNYAMRASIVFMGGTDLRVYHMIQAAIPKYVPWLFGEGNKLTPDDLELAECLFNSKEPYAYIDQLSKMASKYDMRQARVKKLLLGFEKRVDEAARDRTKDEIESCSSRIDSLRRSIAESIQEKNNLKVRLLGLETKIAQNGESSDIMNYFLCNNRLVIEKVEGAQMTFGVRDYVMFYDEDCAQRIIDNKNSYIYTCQKGNISSKDMAGLIKEIFINQTVKLRFCAAYKMDICRTIEAVNNYPFGGRPEYDGYMPNPHIQKFRCLGGNIEKLDRCMEDGNYIGAIEQCISSCRSFNFGDGAVLQTFMNMLYDNVDKCIELPDGEVVTPSQAIEWFKAQTENVEVQEAENE